jgi:dienelactone hydrolase
LLRARAQAALDEILKLKFVNPKKVVAIGYCFGGTTALELARSGAPLVGTVSFHGGLATPTPEDAKNIKGKVLVLHGADDPYVPAKEVADFKEEMKKAKVKMDFVAYKGAVHAFTIPEAGNDNSKGAAYNAEADKKSWVEFQKFLKKTL